VMKLRSAPRPPERPKAFTADRPFAFVIRDAGTGAVLFLGRLTDPAAG